MESPGTEFEYVVIGSGAGGGPLAAHLAEAGHTVLLLEAGGDDEGLAYQVPAFHGAACEDESMCWNFFVKHYEAPERRRADSKLTEEKDGVLYPRAGTLGGCTAHNAMITVYPHDRDWDEIARLTGDPSWNAATMRGYFERLERCTHAERHGSLRERITGRARSLAGRLGLAPAEAGDAGDSGHGFDGWLTTSMPDPALAIKDPQLLKIIVGVAEQVLIEGIGRPLSRFKGRFDPNDKRVAAKSPEGLAVTPLAIDQGRRAGPRDLIRRVQAQYPGRLVVRTHALASRVLLDDTRRAVGVEYLEGEHLYRADPRAASATPTPPVRQVLASREVILCGGAFNTPQLLMLSGIGPAAELTRHKIPVRVDLPGVGRNLQDRYEIGVIAEMASDFKILEGGTFLPPEPNSPPDPALRDWEEGKGLYATNGVVISVVKRSRSTRPDPDLYIFGLPGFFRGYYPGFAKRTERARNCFTWAILKAHTRNTAGFITLRSADPRDMPEINFKYFDEGNDAAGEDLDSVVEGVRFARRLMKQFGPAFKRELIPGPEVPDEKVPDFIKREAWGHHASCSCKMGPSSDEMAVVDSEFRVHGTRNLRVVDASVFPRIPGFFIVSAVYMISEKAADVIRAAAAAAGGEGPAAKVWPVPAPPPVFLGGTRQAEAQRMAAAGRELLQLQHELRAVNADRRPGRAFHRMGIAFRATYTPLTAGLLDARWVPPEIRTALFDPGLRVKDGFARLSYGRGDDNLNGLMPDVRGLWLRLATVNGVQDLTATNAEVPFFDDPEELLAFGFATRQLVQNMRAHPLLTPATLLQYEPQLAAQLMRLKPAEFASKLAAHRRAAAMLAGVTAPGLPVHSLAQTQFWSGAPLYLRGTDGRTYAFKFTFTPDPPQGRRGLPTKDLFSELTRHPRVHYELRTQLYVDDQSTPIERPAKWHVPESKIGDVYVETGGAPISDLVDGEASNPATNLDGISPAGLNRLRADLYAVSARGRSGCPFSGGKLYGRT